MEPQTTQISFSRPPSRYPAYFKYRSTIRLGSFLQTIPWLGAMTLMSRPASFWTARFTKTPKLATMLA